MCCPMLLYRETEAGVPLVPYLDCASFVDSEYGLVRFHAGRALHTP